MMSTPPRRSSSSSLNRAQEIPHCSSCITPTLSPKEEEDPEEDLSLFSPKTTISTKKSLETDGTGATGSTEEKGQATRSLIASVDARQRASERENSLEDTKGSTNEGGSWIELENEVDGKIELNRKETTEEDERNSNQDVSLQFPEAYRLPRSISIKQEEEEDRYDSTFLRHEESELFENPRVTNSQEAEGLDRSVTRSQSDFTKWLEDTMRLARGDGSSVIETDDALSSILQATRQTRFGHSSSADENDKFSSYSSVLDTPVHLEASLPIDGELSFERYEDVKEGIEDEVQVREVEITDEDATTHTIENVVHSRGYYGWKLLSLSLSIALAYSIHRQRTLTHALRPTPSTRFVPTLIDNSTATFSPFATPVPVASSFAVPLYALAFTLLAAVPTSLHLLRRATPSIERASSRSTDSPSPLLELNGDDLLSARERLSLGISHFTARRTQLAVSTLTPILDLACAPLDKALAADWLGRCYYFLARQCGNDLSLLQQAQKAFERSIRLDSTRAEPRGGLGKTKYRLGDFKGAVKAFETAISRDDELWWSYEWLAKSLYQFESKSDGGGGGGSMVEKHLERAIELNPQAYQAQAFIGEILHLEGKTSLALKWLERSISLRIDQPQVHARLAFIANEKLNPSTAEKHFRLVLSTRSTGRVDESCPVSLEAVNGVTPYLSLYFVVPAQDKEARLQVLETALSEYPHDDLVQLLYAVASSSPSVSSSLEARSDRLKKRSERFPQDTFAKGLYALSLLALGEHGQAGEVYSSFWSQVGGGERGGREHVANGSEEEAGKREEKRKIAFLVMAFWEIKNLSASRITKTKTVETISPTTPPVKTREDRKQKTTPKKVTGVERLAEEEEMKPAVAVRRSSRLSRTN